MRPLALSLLAASLLATPAFAQGVMAPGAMPPPPSASEPRPKAEAATPAKKQRAQRRAKAEGQDTTMRPGTAGTSGGGSYRERIDTRPGAGAMELEDDPRSARPIMQNGRPGMGMRF